MGVVGFKVPESLRDHSFALFAGAQFVSQAGNMALIIGINLVAYRGNNLMALVGAVMLIYIPQRVVASLSGRLADKFARRNLLLAANGSLMGLSFVLWWLQHDHQLQHDHPLWWLK